MSLTHSVRIEISLRGDRDPEESAGFVTMQLSNVSAAELLRWLEVPLTLLRDQAERDQPEGEQAR